MADLHVDFLGKRLAGPVIAASPAMRVSASTRRRRA